MLWFAHKVSNLLAFLTTSITSYSWWDASLSQVIFIMDICSKVDVFKNYTEMLQICSNQKFVFALKPHHLKLTKICKPWLVRMSLSSLQRHDKHIDNWEIAFLEILLLEGMHEIKPQCTIKFSFWFKRKYKTVKKENLAVSKVSGLFPGTPSIIALFFRS